MTSLKYVAPNLYKPKLPNRPLDDTEVLRIGFAYTEFDYHGRPLDREEVEGMICYMCDVDSFNLPKMFVKLDDPDDAFTREIRASIEKLPDKQIYKRYVEDILQRVYDRSKEARNRVANLSGFTGRLRHPDHRGIPKQKLGSWGRDLIRRDQYCHIYPIANWCTDETGQPLDPQFAYDIMREKVFDGVDGDAGIVSRLRLESSGVAKYAARLLEGNEGVFGKLAHAKAMAFANENSRPEPLLLLPNPSQSNLDPATTSSLASLSIEATASGSGQFTAPGPSQFTTSGPGQPAAPDDSLTQYEYDFGMRLMDSQPSSNPSYPIPLEPPLVQVPETIKGKGRAQDPKPRLPKAQYVGNYEEEPDWRAFPGSTESQGQDKGKEKAQETNPGSSGDFNIDDLVDYEADEPQLPETPDKGEDKGKQKRQKSSSESPPKGKESKKPPAPETKRQRRGGGKS